MSKQPAFGRLVVLEDAAALASHAAHWLTEQAIASEDKFVVSLSGGSTPKALYQKLGQPPLVGSLPWPRIHWLFGDERYVPAEDPANNAGMARTAFLDHVPATHLHAVQTELPSAEAAAAAYEATLKEVYGSATLQPGRPLHDVCLLGLGEDGHTASLIPGEPVLEETRSLVAVVGHGRPEVRITLTYPALNSSRTVVFLVSGKGKAEVLGKILSGDTSFPAARIRPEGEVIWMVDKAAVGGWAG